MTLINAVAFNSGSHEGTSLSGTAAIVADTLFGGEWMLQCNPTTTNAGSVLFGALTTRPANENVAASRYFGFDFAYGTKPASLNENIFRTTHTSGGSKFNVRLTSGGLLAAYGVGGTTLLATGATVLAANTPYRIEVHAGHGSSASWEVKINGTTEISGSGADLSATNYQNCVLGKATNINGQTVNFYFSNLWIDNAALPGHTYTMCQLLPTAAGASSGWTGTFADVDEQPHDSGTSKLTASSNVKSTFAQTPQKTISGTVHGVLNRFVLQSNFASQTVRSVIRSGSSEGVSTADSDTNYVPIYHLLLTDPATSAAWAAAAAIACEIGIEGTGVSFTTNLSQIIGTAVYTPASAGVNLLRGKLHGGLLLGGKL